MSIILYFFAGISLLFAFFCALDIFSLEDCNPPFYRGTGEYCLVEKWYFWVGLACILAIVGLLVG